jgi:metal-responsive CopG/Arc/MetJ family transcriptional regulator
LTQIHTYETKRGVGRKKLWTERLTLPLTKETVERMDSALAEGEVRLDLIREAIEQELERRERKSSDPAR